MKGPCCLLCKGSPVDLRTLISEFLSVALSSSGQLVFRMQTESKPDLSTYQMMEHY